MGEEFDADRIGRRDVGVVADLTGEGALILILNIEIKVNRHPSQLLTMISNNDDKVFGRAVT